MKSKKRKRGNFFTLLICNYIVFTLLLVIVLSAFFVIGMFVAGRNAMQANPDRFLPYKDIISEGRYEDMPLNKMFGKDVSIVVLNEKLQCVYKSNSEVEVPNFSEDEIEYIPLYTVGAYVYKEEFVNEKNEKCTSISVYCLENDEEVNHKLYVVDEKLNILYQSKNTGKTSLTEREYKLITNTFYENHRLTKYKFKNSYGNAYTMLIYQPLENGDFLFSQVSLMTKSVFSSFFIFYCILIVIFIIWLNHKVKKPLKLLHNAMVKFSEGQRQVYLNYKGPREFEEICESFNHMSMQLYESEENRKKLEKDKQKMIADISHDLKTPITVIQGYAKGIYDGMVSLEEQQQYLETIYKKSEGLTELINTFYEYSKMEHPDYSLNLEKCDICIFLRDYMADKYNEFNLGGFELEIDIPEERILSKIDKVQLKRAFENIINNAIKHNGSGTIFTCILYPMEEYVKIIVADNGCGIQEEISYDIFEPFVVGEKSRSKQGSGLGLAVSKKIIEGHGGSISLVMPPNYKYKTEFEILLPIVKSS
ncbi:HAMP domain-containing sensor histidine kinase [Clostridium ihumii]|uniref:HAMP domain-containing sensor histidine kinase n=1 Tax=Clostridium ihumii TaxID=1470356 RepID=UPI0011DDAE4F|nr:HAMP domain-containing sensor histidine kinase [Clostridium ihumii]